MAFGSLILALCAPALLLSAATVCAAGGKGHPPVGPRESCATAQCHARLSGAGAGTRGGSFHQPAADGECRSCHDLATPAQQRFVKAAGPGDGTERARAWDLALCTGCHGEGLLGRGAEPAATGFADGKRNLHALHVQAGRGRRCLTCHDPHASAQAKLLRERIPTQGDARIPQQFRAEPGGGSCRTGCHAPKGYRR